MHTTPQFLIAAPSSDSGKTTLTLALLRLLADRGLAVQPFKCGPDYLDPTHHTRAARRESFNLDLFMMPAGHVSDVFARRTASTDVAIIEGMMGLFDGSEKDTGSSATLAALLGVPVILVVNGSAMAYSAAALIAGFARFRPEVHVAGVIFNFVDSPGHYALLADACRDVGVEPLGYVPRTEALHLPSRHLGLAISPENDYEAVIARAAAHVSHTVDIDRLLAVTARPVRKAHPRLAPTRASLRIAVARDGAFNFTYRENLEALRERGALEFFSPLRDTVVPTADLIYLAGGYPELFLETLSANTRMADSLRAHVQAGGRIFAECGGLMYLGRQIIDANGRAHPMTGLLPIETSMQNARLTLGYRCVTLGNEEWRGHEFHHSSVRELEPMETAAPVTNARGEPVGTKVYRHGSILASYIHFYWGAHRELPGL